MFNIKRSIKRALNKLGLFRLQPGPIQDLERLRNFRGQFDKFLAQDTIRKLPVEWNERYPCFEDATANTSFDRHYVFHPAWAARVLARTAPALHHDFSSTVNFATMVSAFIPVKFFDYRPIGFNLTGLQSDFADLTKLVIPSHSLASVSCMHVVEHIGLGRYGDPLDPDGDVKAIDELKRVTAKSGDLLFVVPVGRPRVQFNAHRIYGYHQILELFAPFELVEFTLIPDSEKDGNLVVSASNSVVGAQEYGCGCFWFRKPL